MTKIRDAIRFALVVAIASVAGSAGAAEPAGERSTIPETEVSDVAVLPPAGPHRLVIGGGFQGGFHVVDGDKVRLSGAMFSTQSANLAIDPNGKHYYIAETSFARGNRGRREDYISIYDDQLKLVGEVDVPGRLIAVPKKQVFDLSADGRLGYVFNMQPASSVSIVDLAARRLLATVETPGCGLVYPFGPVGFASLCADGTAAVAVPGAKGRYAVTRTRKFFDAEKDPVFEESLVDPATGRALFLTFTGRVLPVTLGPQPEFGEPWSLLEAAGHPLPSTAPEGLAWRPGGSRLAAWHKASNRLYVLMHPGTHWSHKEEGREIWVFDIAARRRVQRIALEDPVGAIAVTQDAEPLLFAVGGPGPGPGGGLIVLDARTGEQKGRLGGLGGSLLGVHEAK